MVGNKKINLEFHLHIIILALFDCLVSMLGRQQTLRGYPHCQIYISIKCYIIFNIQKH